MTTQRRVVHVYKAYPPVRGGIEGHIALLARLSSAHGVTASVLCARSRGEAAPSYDGAIAVQRCLAPLTLASTPLPPALPWALRQHPADIVHLHLPWPPGEVAWLLGGRRRPLAVTVHCEAVRQARLARSLRPLTAAVLQAAGRIFVTGAFMSEAPALAAHRARVQVVPLGVDLEHWRPDASAPDPLPDVPHPRVVFVGRLRHYKGLPVLAAALARLPDAHLVVVGDGPERAPFTAALRAAGCADRAHLLGDIGDDRLRRVYQTADAAVLTSTSRAEAFGLAIAEAQACGVPAVTTAVGTGTEQTVAEGLSGRVVSPGDPEATAAAVAWCLDPAHVAVRRAAARTHAETHLCARRMTATICAAYDAIAAGRGLGPRAARDAA